MKIVNENINKYLYGPSEEEIDKRIEKSNINVLELVSRSIQTGQLIGVKKVFEKAKIESSLKSLFLMDAAEYGHLDIVKYLHEQGADIYASDHNALRLAAEYGHLDIVKYLVENGANIHATNDYALRVAERRGRTDVVNYLKSKINEE